MMKTILQVDGSCTIAWTSVIRCGCCENSFPPVESEDDGLNTTRTVDITPPEGWRSLTPWGGMCCPECVTGYHDAIEAYGKARKKA